MRTQYGHVCFEQNIESIPTLSSSKMRLFQALLDEDTSIRSVEEIISCDPAMAAKVIKLANSSYYRHYERIAGIHDALLTVGFDMVKCITLSMAIMDTFGSNIKYFKELWKHSYSVALTVFSLGKDKKEKDCLFTGGLLHDLGRMAFLYKSPDEYISLIEFEQKLPDIDIEQAVFSTDHTILGSILAEKWHFPKEVVDIIRNHHNPQNRLSALINLSDMVVSQQEMNIDVSIIEQADILRYFAGEEYKNLVNEIIQRYKINTPIIENLS